MSEKSDDISPHHLRVNSYIDHVDHEDIILVFVNNIHVQCVHFEHHSLKKSSE